MLRYGGAPVLMIRPCETDEIRDVLALWAASRSAAASTPDTHVHAIVIVSR
jgi:hypothetical protein